VVCDSRGRAVSGTAGIREKEKISVRMRDGGLACTVDKKTENGFGPGKAGARRDE
jgi:hypothetical protein